MQFYQAVFSNLPTLETARLRLRPIRREDAAAVFSYTKDTEVTRHVLWDAHQTIAQARRFIRFLRRQYRRGLPASFAIALQGSDRVIGTIGFMWVNTDHQSAEIGYSLSREYWNKGLMTEALRAVLAFGFDTLHLNRIEGQHDTQNPASGKVMQHAGMQYEGLMRQRLRNKGRFIDVACYAILKSDPRPQYTKEETHPHAAL